MLDRVITARAWISRWKVYNVHKAGPFDKLTITWNKSYDTVYPNMLCISIPFANVQGLKKWNYVSGTYKVHHVKERYVVGAISTPQV